MLSVPDNSTEVECQPCLAQTTFAIGACQQRDQQGLHQFRGLEEPEKKNMGHCVDCITEGKQIPALFPAPGLQIDCFAIDWLHACDLGVARDFLGNLISFLLDRFPGASKDKRLSSVCRSMQSFYRRYSADNRLDNFDYGMPRKNDKKQTKSQLPSLEHLVEKPGLSYHGAWQLQKHCWTSPTPWKQPFSRPHWMLAIASFQDLWNPQELATAGQRFLLLYVSLSDSDPKGMFWGFKPKHHLFQELCEFDEWEKGSLKCGVESGKCGV